MKILITTDTFRPTINGVVTSIESLKKALDRRGHDTRILTFSDSFNSKQEKDIYYMGSLGAGKFYPDARMNKLLYNRFYEDAMQLKNGNFSYFLSLYGFQQSGRIVNALYGPFFSYLQGGLVLISGTWFRYQIV
ncbi:MAG: hypothetical protein E6779_07590, partial [Finegoldia magna]|nr:hypothetical protein [Finegoldia magna]